MDEQSRRGDLPNLPRFHFHVTLGLIFSMLLIPWAVTGGWLLAIIDVVKGYSSRAQLWWTRALVGLVLVDALVLGAYLWIQSRPEEFQPRPPAEAKRSMIGVAFDSQEVLRIRELAPDRPGSRAGLQVGDVIEQIDGTAVATPKALGDALKAEKVRTVRTLTIRRGGLPKEVAVTPETPPAPGAKGLFEIEPVPDLRVYDDVILDQLPALALVALLIAWGALRPRRSVPVWGGFLLARLGTLAGSVGFLAWARARWGGLSLGLFLMSLLIQTLLMLGLTAAARLWLTRSLAPELPSMPPLRAGMQGFFYLITGTLRIWLLVRVGVQLLAPDFPMGDPLVFQLSEARFGLLGQAMLVGGVVLLGPLAEEFLFRGYLLPRLAAQWGEAWALFSSSLLFALLHLRDGPFLPMIFFYGWVFGWVRMRSGSIVPSTALHMAVNSAAAAAILLQT